MNIQPVFMRYDINRKIPFDRSSPVVVDHVEDFDTRFIEVYVYESIYNKQVDLKGTTITARIVAALSTEKILLNDNVVCAINGSGNIIIPIDGKVIETLASVLLIEIRITQGKQALVLPFPLYVQMRGSILDDAGVAPESRGTIPELLEAAIAALEEAKNYENLENKPQINGHTLSGDKTSDELGLQKKLTAGQNITIANDGTISAEGGGVTSYDDLSNKPQINGVTLSGNKTSSNLGLQSELTAGNTMQIEGGVIDVTTYSLNLSYFTHLVENNILYSGYDNSNGSLTQFEKAAIIVVTDDDITNSKYSVGANGEIPINKAGTFFNFPEKTDLPPFGKTSSHWARYYITNDGEIYVGGHGVTLISQYPVPRYAWGITPYVKILSPSATIVSGVVNQNGTITFTDSDGNTFTTTGASVIGPQGNPGQDYVLTNQDKSDIADIVLGELPTTEGVLYGNTNN